jgi:flagellar hook assembly protein FlgD
LPVAGKVTLEVYSILGQRVATLIDEQQEAGFKLFEWNASAIPSGVYFYRLSASDGKMTFADVKKMILVR